MSNLKKSIVFLAIAVVAVTLSSVTLAEEKPFPPSRTGPPVFNPTPQGDGCVGADVTDLHVTLQIVHTWVGDLQVSLESPGAGPVMIIDRPGAPAPSGALGCSNDDIDVILFDTAGGGSVEAGCNAVPPAVSGNRTPSPGLLAAFNGETLSGVWTLTVADLAGGDTGRIVNWCLAEGAGEACCSAPGTVIEDNTVSTELDLGGTDGTDGTTTPAVGTWGILAMISLLLAASLFHFRRRAEQA